MAHPTHPRPKEPFVDKNIFRQKKYRPEPIRPFAEIKEQLPIPVLPLRPEWVEMYWRAWETAWSHLRQPKPESGFIANFIETAFNEHTFMWDSAFMMQYGVYGRRLFPFMGTLNNFYAKQHDDGYICREIHMHLGTDYFTPYDPDGTGPNILAWSEWRWFRATGDEERLAQVFWPLMAYHRWFRQHRSWPSGLYWATGLSSGMDNQTRVPGGKRHHQHWSWVDASMQACLNCHMLEQMAARLGEEACVSELAEERARLISLINAHLWDEATAFYYDMSPRGTLSSVKSIGAYWGLLDNDLVPQSRKPPFIQHLREVNEFKRFHRIPTQSADSEGYDADSGDYWRGSVWPPTNYMVLKGLRENGFRALAHEIAMNHLERVAAVFQVTDTFWENYAPETAAPGSPARPNFVGWSGLSPISILIEDVLGICSDWPQRRIEWDRRLDCPDVYGIRQYPLGPDGVVDLLGDKDGIDITTNVPVTLIVRDEATGLSMQTAVSPGTTHFNLT